MSLIPFILDLADELHDFNRSMDVDEDFGVYAPPTQPHPHVSRRGGVLGGLTGGAMMWVPVKGQPPQLQQQQPPQQQQHHQQQQQQHHQHQQQQQQHQHQHQQQQHQQQQHQHQQQHLQQQQHQQAATQRHHPYRVAAAKTICCNRTLQDVEKEMVEKSAGAGMNSGSGIGTGSGMNAGFGMQPRLTNSAYSMLNRNGYQVSMNVKQFTHRELTVKTINDCIVVEGQHDEKEDGHGVISRHFIRKYILPRGYDPAEVRSTLSTDGILTLRAPPPPPPVFRPGGERLERMVKIQQISHQQQPQWMHAGGAARGIPANTPTHSLSLSVSLAESNGNSPEETETEPESAEATAAPSPSLSSEAAAAVAAVESTSNSSTDSSANNGIDEPESMEGVAGQKEEEEAAKEEEPIPTATPPTPAAVVSSSGGGNEEPAKAEDANANDMAVASNNGNGAATAEVATEGEEMPPKAPGEEKKKDKEDKADGGEESADVDAAKSDNGAKDE